MEGLYNAQFRTEKAFETKVRKFLDDEGAYILKTWGGGMQRSGLPDLLMCINGYFVAVEVKGERGRPSELQLHNIKEIKQAGGLAMVLYPKDFERFKELIRSLKSATVDELPHRSTVDGLPHRSTNERGQK